MIEKFPPPGFVPAPSAIPGIEVYQPAPPDAGPQEEVVDFKCPQCGAVTAFNAAEGGLTCAHCGYYEGPEKAVVGKGAAQFEFTVETLERSAQGWGVERKELECQNCGARTSAPAKSLAHTCLFCGSNKVIQRQAPQDILRPRFVVPFKLDPEACQKIARLWLGSSWMTPADLHSETTLAGFKGIYLPYWTFDAHTRAGWRAEVGHTEVEYYMEKGERKSRTRTVWRWESGEASLDFDDLLVNGTGRLSELLLAKVKKFDLAALAPYEPKYLAGLEAQAYDIPLEQAWETARQQMREETRQACLRQASTSQVRNFSMLLDFSEETWRYLLLPVYLTSYQYEGKPFQVMVNGQSGVIAGQRPADWNKVWLVVIALLAPGVLLGLLGLATVVFGGIGVGIGGIGFVFLVIGAIIAIIILRQAYALDDA